MQQSIIPQILSALQRSLVLVLLAGATACKDTPPLADDNYAPTIRPSAASTAIRSDLAPGDEIEVFVMEDEKFNGKYKVREGGDVILPKLGRVKVSGASLKGAESLIKAALERDQLTKATVIVDRTFAVDSAASNASISRLTIYLSGAVNRPGQHDIAMPAGNLGAYEALIIAGGAHRLGDERKVQVLRRKSDGARQTIQIDLGAIKSGSKRDLPLQQGDIILVPERAFVL